MEMISSKKGIYFTLVTVIIIGILIGYSYFDNNDRIKQKGNVLSNRAISMNNLILDIEKDIDRMILISGYRSVLSIEKYLSENEDFLDDFDDVFSPLFTNGSYNGTVYNLMANASLNDWETRIQEETDVMNLDFNIIPRNIWVEHTSPWDIRIYVNATILLEDKEILWNYTKIFDNEMSIAYFEDPLYKIKTQDKITNLLIPSTITDFIDDSTNDTTNLQMHYNNSYYRESTNGSSFLMRFEGNFSSSPYGIESMVNINKLNAQGITPDEKSLIDYIYFDDSSTTIDYCNFEGMPTEFRIDSDHLEPYELDEIYYEVCP